MSKKQKTLTALSIAAVLTAVYLGWDLFEQIVLIYVDDIMYSDWTKHGLRYFIGKNIWHYNNFNGRFFVHLIMQLVTFFDEHLYAILAPIFVLTGAFLFATAANRNWPAYKRLFMAALALVMFLGMPRLYMTNVLWISGGFNYVFPLLIVSGFYFLFRKYREKISAIWWLWLPAFISGATTEQYGMYTIGLLTMTVFFDYWDTRKIHAGSLLCIGASVAGLLSVFLAPSTFRRFSSSVAAASSQGFWLVDGYLTNFSYLNRGYGPVTLPVLFMLLMAVFALCKKTAKAADAVRYSSWLLLGFPFSLIALLAEIFQLHTLSAILTTVYIAVAIAAMLANPETRELGKVLLCGFGTFFMMSITAAAGYRTCIPCILSFIIVIAVMFVDTVLDADKKAISGVVLAALVLICLGTYRVITEGYKEENPWCQEVYDQLAASGETNSIAFDFDETIVSQEPKYRYLTLFDNSAFFPFYQEKFGIPDGVKIQFRSRLYALSSICLDGSYSFLPAVTEGSKVYIPLSAFWSPEVNGETVSYQEGDVIEITQYYGTTVYLEIARFCQQLGYSYEYNAAENTYFFAKAVS